MRPALLALVLLAPSLAGCTLLRTAELRDADHAWSGTIDPQGASSSGLAWEFIVPRGATNLVWTEALRYEEPLFVNLSRDGALQMSHSRGFGDAEKRQDAGRTWGSIPSPPSGRWAYEIESAASARVGVWMYVCLEHDARAACDIGS